MFICIPDPATARSLLELEQSRDDARGHYFAHSDPGGLTPATKHAFELDHFALQLILAAAQKRLDAGFEMSNLMSVADDNA